MRGRETRRSWRNPAAYGSDVPADCLARGAVTPTDAEHLRESVRDYHRAAQDVSRRLIAQETGEAILDAMANMQIKQRAVAEALNHTTNVDYRHLTEHFAAIQAARTTAARLRIGVGVVCWLVLLLREIQPQRPGRHQRLSLGFLVRQR